MALVCNRDKRGGGQSRTSWFMNEGDVSMFTLSDERQGSKQRKIISLYLLDLPMERAWTRGSKTEGTNPLHKSRPRFGSFKYNTQHSTTLASKRREHLYLVRNTFRLSESLTNSSYQPCHM